MIPIPWSEITLTYVRSSGPGGQNVNKVNSKAVLRWNLTSSPGLSLPLRALLVTRLASHLTRSGDLVLTSDRYRDQARNREDCVQKLGELVKRALTTVRPRKKTRPTRASRVKREDQKTRHAAKKRLRRYPD
jgi:ribosome-associated protein